MSTKALKNYYVVLGVHRGENAKGIRAAYKDLAKQFHPDRIGEQGNKTFQEISEAYQTLFSGVGYNKRPCRVPQFFQAEVRLTSDFPMQSHDHSAGGWLMLA